MYSLCGLNLVKHRWSMSKSWKCKVINTTGVVRGKDENTIIRMIFQNIWRSNIESKERWSNVQRGGEKDTF